ncbi:MAG: secondary thiamine-phosphate synthase enzyme YjbQ [Dehalococcoidales bacterium]|nr:secondary thiamine-phosphate synthase enzyme YjbQ [Dehalococcoidales bacterium]
MTRRLSLQSKGNNDIIEITPHVERLLTETKLLAGSVTVFVTGSTAGITTIEHEPGLLLDFKAAWERIVPENIDYEHNRAWEDGNGHSHVRASLLGASLVVPFNDKKLVLGTWQQIVLVDFDNRPRSREVVVQVTGE